MVSRFSIAVAASTPAPQRISELSLTHFGPYLRKKIIKKVIAWSSAHLLKNRHTVNKGAYVEFLKTYDNYPGCSEVARMTTTKTCGKV